MAIVKAPALSLEASGNLGGINYTRWRGRAVARSSWTPTIPNTTKQIAIQALLTFATVNWSTVFTEEQREGWGEYAKTQTVIDRLGDVHCPSGYNLYVSRQIQAARVGGGVLFEPPMDLEFRIPTRIGTESVLGGTRLQWRGRDRIGGADPMIQEGWAAGPFTTEARHPTSDEWRFVEYRETPLRLRLTVVVAEWYWLRVRAATTDGRVSNWFQGQQQAVV